ncbi:hypothetical protein [Herbaspirillum sp. NPDC101397]|uniref:hypothetical protein n=1 Tax=Herbaspirillum sp. NPDC101397 TaxID=3364006 RepID=UPI00383AB34B
MFIYLRKLRCLRGLSLILVCFWISSPAFGFDDVMQKMENFAAIQKNSLSQLQYWSGNRFEKIVGQLNYQYPNYKIMGVCQASVMSPGERDFGIALVNVEKKSAVYLVALVGENEKLSLTELFQFDISFSNRGNIQGRGLEVICPSWTEISRIKFDYSKSSVAAGRYSNLKVRTKFDAICGAPTDGDVEYVCFQYDTGARRFYEIGYWKNECSFARSIDPV